ncbi:MAG: hypothetical protein J5766_04910 [Clostridia bacterium]|nr:hypothetical protein [Clostridia bacterium]
MGEIFALDVEDDEKQTATLEDAYIYAFKHNGTYYRAIATITDDAKRAIDDLDFDDEDYWDNVAGIIAPLKIDKFENLSKQILSQKELDKLVGKTGQYLLDHDWYSNGYDLETMKFRMNKDPFCYLVVFDGHVDKKDYEDFDDSIDILELKVKSVKFYSLGDACKR